MDELQPPAFDWPPADYRDLATERHHQPVFRTLRFDSRVARAGALYALRMIEGMRLQSRMLRRGDIVDHDLLTLVGLELQDNPGNCLGMTRLSAELTRRRRQLEKGGEPRLPVLEGNIGRLGDSLRLGSRERAVLRLATIVQHVSTFRDLLRLGTYTPTAFYQLVRHAIGGSLDSLQRAMGPSAPMRRAGVLDDFDLEHGSHPLEMPHSVATMLLTPGFDPSQFLRRMLTPAPKSPLTVADFAHNPDANLIHRYLQTATRKGTGGINVLIHGSPGTGKTEFVRALAASLGRDLHEVPVEDQHENPIGGRDRLRAFSLAQQLLNGRPGQMLLFDEVEDVFGIGDLQPLLSLLASPRRGSRPDDMSKGWINTALESNPVPAVWVCNGIDSIDPAHLRRFDLVAEFRPPTRSVRRRMLRSQFGDTGLSLDGIETLADLQPLPPAQIARAAKVVRQLGSRCIGQRDAEARQILSMWLRAMGHRTVAKSSPLPGHYDPAVLNTDNDLDRIAAGLGAGRPARLCLYGPPGTGKSALGVHLARTLDRPLLAKRGSDLISPWIGGTERNLAAAFEEAGDENAVLLIDEADGFLQDRGRARNSWEITGVNELLTQMEAFDGIFVASTNLVETLDAAALRRFDFKIRFDFLDRGQRRRLLDNVLRAHGAPDVVDGASLRRLDRMDRLTPGDFANVLRQLAVTGEAVGAASLLDLLEAELRMKPGAERSGIGFLADPHGDCE